METGGLLISDFGNNTKTAENAEVYIICRSDFSREHRLKFATKAAPTNTCKFLCVLCASARVKI